LIVSVLENVGLLDVGLNMQEAPAGRPLVQERITDPAVPDSRVAVIVFEPEVPRVTVIPPEFDNE
jgi:hypothetical protein